ncbi:MAG: lysine--tRNA ligase, partial [Desulfuromonadales bacterium]|nr:lysine--tRNA ligase [Desulfuromonadales bacterium]
MSAESHNEIVDQRRIKLNDLREQGQNPFANGFSVDATTEEVSLAHADHDKEALESVEVVYHVAGRIMAKRDFGKAAFIQIQDRTGRLQIYVAKNQVGEESFELFRKFDLGDIVGLAGRPFRTKTDELSLRAESIQLLTKSLQPLPEKWHGLTDVETRYRQRYL